jgi:CRAL/TRIO domain
MFEIMSITKNVINFQPSRDASNAAIALFTANLHSSLAVSHKTTLQGIVYQLDVALQNSETQKAGLIFIYDMSMSKYSNFDYDLSQKILTLLKVCDNLFQFNAGMNEWMNEQNTQMGQYFCIRLGSESLVLKIQPNFF